MGSRGLGADSGDEAHARARPWMQETGVHSDSESMLSAITHPEAEAAGDTLPV